MVITAFNLAISCSKIQPRNKPNSVASAMSSPIYQLHRGTRSLTFDQPRIMAVVNCTPDSFFSGSRAPTAKAAVRHGLTLLQAGADVLDIGGQSTRPGAEEVRPEAEWKRIEGAVKGLLDAEPKTLLSIDTFHHEVAGRALEAGAFMINDIYAGTRDDAMLKTVASARAPYAIMHMQGTPATMQLQPHYNSVTKEVFTWLETRMLRLKESGIDQLLLDVGFGFGKSLEHNFQLLNDLAVFSNLQAPLLVGLSRKSMVYKTLGTTAESSLNGTTALHAWALDRGAHMLRVHDVAEAREAAELHRALR